MKAARSNSEVWAELWAGRDSAQGILSCGWLAFVFGFLMSVPSPSPEATGRALAAPVWGIHFLDWLGRICLSAVPAYYSIFTSNFPFICLTYYIFYCILDIFRDTAFLEGMFYLPPLSIYRCLEFSSRSPSSRKLFLTT